MPPGYGPRRAPRRDRPGTGGGTGICERAGKPAGRIDVRVRPDREGSPPDPAGPEGSNFLAGTSLAARLEGGDLLFLGAQVVQLVHAVEEAIAGEGVDGEA